SATHPIAAIDDMPEVFRPLGSIGVSGIALDHHLDLRDNFSAVPYMAWIYVALILGSVENLPDRSRRWTSAMPESPITPSVRRTACLTAIVSIGGLLSVESTQGTSAA